MRVEEVVSSFIMFIVSGLVLVGFTIAWYTNNNMPAVTGMSVVAAEAGDVKVALVSGGDDISTLEGDAKYAALEMVDFADAEEYIQVDSDEGTRETPFLFPGACGKVTFYLTPTSSSVSVCEILPTLRITPDGTSWYPDVSAGGAEAGGSDGESSENGDAEVGESNGESGGTGESGAEAGGDAVTIEELYEIAQAHIVFFADEAMTVQIAEDALYTASWLLEERLTEKKVDLYWKWYYEYPFTAEQLQGDTALSDVVKEEYIRTYDEKDMLLGNNVSRIKFYFTFSAK